MELPLGVPEHGGSPLHHGDPLGLNMHCIPVDFFKDAFTTTLYIGFGPTFGLFHYAKLPSYKRVR